MQEFSLQRTSVVYHYMSLTVTVLKFIFTDFKIVEVELGNVPSSECLFNCYIPTI